MNNLMQRERHPEERQPVYSLRLLEDSWNEREILVAGRAAFPAACEAYFASANFIPGFYSGTLIGYGEKHV